MQYCAAIVSMSDLASINTYQKAEIVTGFQTAGYNEARSAEDLCSCCIFCRMYRGRNRLASYCSLLEVGHLIIDANFK